jgi:hypothetical protein
VNLEDLYSILNEVLENRVCYGTNVYDDESNVDMPYIVYQETSKFPIGYHDDMPILYKSTIQITLVTKDKTPELEKRLESYLLNHGIAYEMINEFSNSDKSINRIYEIKMEE